MASLDSVKDSNIEHAGVPVTMAHLPLREPPCKQTQLTADIKTGLGMQVCMHGRISDRGNLERNAAIPVSGLSLDWLCWHLDWRLEFP